MNLLRSQWHKSDCPVVMNQRILIGVTIMRHPLIKLPRPSEKYVPRIHGSHVTQHLIFILSNSKRYQHLLSNSNFSSIVESLKLVRARMTRHWKSKLIHLRSTSNIGTTSAINDQTTHLVLNMASIMKYVLPLLICFLLGVHVQRPL